MDIRKIAEDIVKKADSLTDEQKTELESQIDWKGFEALISKEVRTPVTFDISKTGRGKITFQSKENLADKAGIFSDVGAFKVLRIEDFGTSFGKEDNNFYTSVSLRWEFSDGGTNGHTLFRAWYDFDKKAWDIRK